MKTAVNAMKGFISFITGGSIGTSILMCAVSGTPPRTGSPCVRRHTGNKQFFL